VLSGVRAEVSVRFSEVLQVLEHIKSVEKPPPIPDVTEAKILRGLFYVHLYSALEYTINQGVRTFLQAVAGFNAQPHHYQARFLSVALDSEFNSIRNIGEDRRWGARLKLIALQSSSDPQVINNDLFGLYLQNVWIKKLETIFECLDINDPVVPDSTYRGYVDEVVERRNAVAHGRESAADVGAARRGAELLIRYNAINATCIHFLDCLESQHIARGVIQPIHRDTYL
jgi:hypothetical protein